MGKKRMTNARISISLVLLFFFSLILPTFPPHEQAAEAGTARINQAEDYINKYSDDPVYEMIQGSVTDRGFSTHGESSVITPSDSVEVQEADEEVTSLEELEEVVSDYLHDWESDLVVRFTGDTGDADNLTDNIKIIIEDKIMEDNHYIKYSLGYGFELSGHVGDAYISFVFDFMTTKEQEEYVDEEVERILGEIITPGINDHLIAKEINDYIVENVSYDESDDESLMKHTAYAALAYGEAVCQGYALLAYKMLNEEGVEAKIISGEADGGTGVVEGHAWNLVKIEGLWYHLDCTWNVVSGYDYYNKTDSYMSGTHVWEEADYPACNTGYDEAVSSMVDALFDGDELDSGVTEADIDDADTLIEVLPDGEAKNALKAQVEDAYTLLAAEPDPEEAEEAVDDLYDGEELAEGVTEANIDDALAMVESLQDGDEKDTLMARIDTAYDLLETEYEPDPDPDVFYGDVNIDGQVTVADAITVLRYIVGLTELSEEQELRAKVSEGDGGISVADAILILRFIVGLVEEFPAETAA